MVCQRNGLCIHFFCERVAALHLFQMVDLTYETHREKIKQDTRNRAHDGINIVFENKILHGDNLAFLRAIPDASIRLIYIDPPFNTGKIQSRTQIKTESVDKTLGDRVGFCGKSYKTKVISKSAYNDSFTDYVGFLRPRLAEAYRILTADGSLFFHIDWRESARCRLPLEDIFGGCEYCMNEIVWAYDFGARSKQKWPAKHDNIYWFAKNPKDYIFNYDDLDRIPYMAPDLVGVKKAAHGKTPTDTWWQTIVPTNSKEKTGYPTQKPLPILERIARAHSNVGDTVLGFFCW